MKRFKYSKKDYNIKKEYQVITKMPSELKQLIRLYEKLDICDLDFLKYKHTKEKNRFRLKTTKFVRDDLKSNESEIIRHKLEYRYMGNHIIDNILDGETIIYDNTIQD